MQAIQLKLVQQASIAAALAAALSFTPAYAQRTPPIAEPGTATSAAAPLAPPSTVLTPLVDAPAPDSNIWNWQDVPKNQQIVVDRAVFDQGGYQLYCHTGETIVVPFVDHNLYVMKFGQSDGPMYFVTDGATPILYIPFGGYLENATAAGAKWYPFPRTFDYLFPVYVGPAPCWDDYAAMGWYPGMVYYGGYWGSIPFTIGVTFGPTSGWSVWIDGFEIDGWLRYRDYVAAHPAHRILAHDVPGYRYDRFTPRGPGIHGANRPFGTRPFARPAGDDRNPHSSELANPRFHAHMDFQVVPVVSHLGNPNRARPETPAAVQLASVKEKPVLLGNPRFLPQSAAASLPGLSSHPISDIPRGPLAAQSHRLTDGTPPSTFDLKSHKALLDKAGISSAERSPLWSEKIYHDRASHDEFGTKSKSNSGLFRKAFSSASSWVHDYAKSKGGGSSSDHGEHSGHSEKEAKSSSSGSSNHEKKK